LPRKGIEGEVPLFVFCLGPNCKPTDRNDRTKNLAQLQRIFILTPPAMTSTSLIVNPKVQWSKTARPTTAGGPPTGGRKWTFDMGFEMELPWDSLLCLRLPYVYAYKDRPLVKTRHNDQYTCQLLGNYLYCK